MTLFQTLCHGLEAQCDSDVQIRLIETSDAVRTISIAELRERALGLLHHFRGRGIRSGDELIICTDNNLAFLDAFWACQLGGITAVPLAPGVSEQQRQKLFNVHKQLRRPFLFTDLNTGARIRALADKMEIHGQYQKLKSNTVLSDHIDDLRPDAEPVARAPEDAAFIQFSSGSTGDPKGIVLKHRNLCANIQDIQLATGLHDSDRGLSWMPLTHDMGLIGFHLAMLMAGVTHSIMATSLFVRRPTLWLQLAQREEATFLCSPNFGYRLFLKAFDRWQIENLDLSRIRFILNGAEPISAEVCREFIEKLSPYGLKSTAMVPGYGLAEASLAVSFGDREKGIQSLRLRRDSLGPGQTVQHSTGADTVEVVEAGRPVTHCRVKITSDDGATVDQGQVGNISIRGPNVTGGYYGQNSLPSEGWLGTGDLGFFDDGRLYVTGRTKDVLFSHGQNFYAHDLENMAASMDGIEAGRVVVSAASDRSKQAEIIVVFIQHFGNDDGFRELAARVLRLFGQQAGLEVAAVIPVDEIPRTTSGKVRRYVLRQAYENGDFDTRFDTLDSQHLKSNETGDTSSVTEDALLDICAGALGNIKLQRQDNFFELGMSSLKAIEIHELIDQFYPGQLEVSDIFEHPTLAELAGFLDEKTRHQDSDRQAAAGNSQL